MNYADMRPSIRSGDLIAESGGGFKSWHDIKVSIVRMFTRSTYSHVGICWVVGKRVFVIEAVMPKTRIYPLSLIGDFYHLPMNATWSSEAEEFALSRIGTDYSQMTAMKAPFIELSDDNCEECAAFVHAILLHDGIHLEGRATPDQLIHAAQKRGSPVTLVENAK